MISFRQIELAVKAYANALPLDVFALLGSFAEEIVPPIPAPLIMTTVGSLALTQGLGWLYLAWLAVAGSIGKTFASWIFYIIGDKFEDIVIGKFGKFVGIGHHDVESLGKRFSGGFKDAFVLFFLRSIPIFPSVSVSVVCGVIRLNPRSFIVATFFGTIVKNLLYLAAGYGGLRAIGFFARRIHEAHFWFGLFFLLLSALVIYWLVRGRKK